MPLAVFTVGKVDEQVFAQKMPVVTPGQPSIDALAGCDVLTAAIAADVTTTIARLLLNCIGFVALTLTFDFALLCPSSAACNCLSDPAGCTAVI